MAITLNLLRIKNLALVDELEWQVAPGFTAVTGETGAGKSIIIGALQLVLGGRADKSLIRTGAEISSVEAVFNGADLSRLNRQFEQMGVEPGQDELILKRSFSVSGVNRQFINGSATTLSNLEQVGDELVDLHGPHEHQSLLSPDKQLELLDAFAGAGEARANFAAKYLHLRHLQERVGALATAETAREQEIELLRHQTHEIEAANLDPHEEAEIEARYRLATNSKRLIELASIVANQLSEAENSVLSQLAETQKLLQELEKLDPAMGGIANMHQTAIVELSEISRDLSGYAEKLDLDPDQLASLEDRISLFETLKRKYGSTLPDVLEFGRRAGERLRRIEDRDQELERLSSEIQRQKIELEKAGMVLRKMRARGAPKLAATVRENLRALGFKRSGFEVKMSQLDTARSWGFDTAELLFSANPGEPLKALRSIASSGEISRLMLAIKSVLAAEDAVPLLVFDEIDANVGGEIAHAVGARLKHLASQHQVLCITHLPQVAAAATSHFVVRKEVTRGRTFSELRPVTGRERQEEIARMLGGKSQEAMKLAATMLGDRATPARDRAAS